jgi:hypothetical protein
MKPYQGTYKPDSEAPYKLSRSKIENFIRCQRCFVLDRVHGVSQPSGPPFLLNSAVDSLYKKEFDRHRDNGTVHPVVAELGYNFIPFRHEKMDEWRANFTGISFLHHETNLHLFGAVDDIWLDADGKLIVVDYKATAKAEPIEELTDAFYHDSYRRQMEFYQWLLRKNGFQVSDTGYWLYATARNNSDDFNQTLVFDSRLIAHVGDTSWIDGKILEIKDCLNSRDLPGESSDCDFCNYSNKRRSIETI